MAIIGNIPYFQTNPDNQQQLEFGWVDHVVQPGLGQQSEDSKTVI